MLTSVTEAGEIVAAGLVLIRQMPLGTTLFYLLGSLLLAAAAMLLTLKVYQRRVQA